MFQLMPVFEVMILLMSFPKCLTEKVLAFRFWFKVTIALAHMFKLADFHKNCPRPAAGRLSTVFYGCGRPWLWSHGCGRLGCGKLQPCRPLIWSAVCRTENFKSRPFGFEWYSKTHRTSSRFGSTYTDWQLLGGWGSNEP